MNTSWSCWSSAELSRRQCLSSRQGYGKWRTDVGPRFYRSEESYSSGYPSGSSSPRASSSWRRRRRRQKAIANRRRHSAIAGRTSGSVWKTPKTPGDPGLTRKLMTVASWFPAASYAVTRTVWSPSDQRRLRLVVVPTDCVGPPSMLTSYRAMPEAVSEPVHEIVRSGLVWTPLGEPPSVGGVRSTSIDVDAFGSTKPAVSQDW